MAKAGSMPSHECFGLDDRDGVKNRGKPSIQLHEEPAVTVRKLDTVAQLAPQHDQLLSERRMLGFKPVL